MAIVCVHGPLRKLAGGATEHPVDGATIGDLLRALEQREILPVGGTAPRALDVRIISATNKALPDLISSGAFRWQACASKGARTN